MDADAVEWALRTVGAGVVEPTRTRPWSEVGRVRGGRAVWWLKINKAGTTYEPGLLRVLADTGSRLLPEVVIHPVQPWIIVADAGQRLVDLDLGQERLLELWCRVVAEYAELQREVPTDELLRAGVPDLRPSRLAPAYETLLDDQQWFSALVASGLTAEERELAKGFVARCELLAAELSEGPPATVQHDDVHETNVVIDPRHLDRPRLIDWGDAVISHPFCSMGVTLDRLSDRLGVPVEHPLIMRVTDVYLEPWRADGWVQRHLRRQLRIARRLDPILRAHAWIRAVDNLEAARTVGFAEAPPYWIRRLIATEPEAPIE